MSQRLTNALKNRARAWAGQLTSLAKGFAPNHLKPYIHTTREEKGGGTFILRLKVDRKANPLQKWGSADARAQEYGSGLHSQKGSKAKYTIIPKNKPFLVFPWEVATANPERFTLTKNGDVVLPYVRHPGIKGANNGAGYIRPAVKELRKRGRAELDKDIRQAILGDLRQSFGRKA